MEKIYEENNNSQRTSQINVSVVLSFVVAAFAIVSLVAFGFDQISYADPSAGVGAAAGESITAEYKKEGSNQIHILASKSGGGVATIPWMISGSQNVFCTEYGETFDDSTYSPEMSGSTYVSDPGIAYIINHVHDKVKTCGILNTDNNAALTELEVYVTQVSIWFYQLEVNRSAPGTFPIVLRNLSASSLADLDVHSSDEVKLIERIDSTDKDITTVAADIKGKYVDDLVSAAISARNNASSTTKTVTLNLKSDNVKQLDDEETYSSDEFSVGGNSLTGYRVALSGDLADDAYVVSGGNKKSSADVLLPNEKFSVYVPKSKLSEEKKGVTVSVTGNFMDNTAVFYTKTGYQKIITLKEVPKTAGTSKKIYFMVTPDTGLSTAQTIYFIGLIVLLCGVGIIYANAKPVEEK